MTWGRRHFKGAFDAALALCGALALSLSLCLIGVGPARAADVQRGAQLYAMHCAACHGANGSPVMPGAADFTKVKTVLKPDSVLLQSVRSGKGVMPAYLGILTDADILSVVAYLRTLSF